MRRLFSVGLLCLGVANLVWLNRDVYPKYHAHQQSALVKSGTRVPRQAISKEGGIDPKWMQLQLNEQAPVLLLDFARAGYLPKASMAQVRTLALNLARRSDNYWVQLAGGSSAAPGTQQAKVRYSEQLAFVRDLLVQSGLRRERVLLAQPDATRPSRVPSLSRVEIRVLEVQSQ